MKERGLFRERLTELSFEVIRTIKVGGWGVEKIRKAVIPAAGLGTRFLPATKALPKEMLPVVDKPALQYIVEEVVQSGIEEILIITGRQKSSIEDHFDRSVELELELKRRGQTELLSELKAIAALANIHYIRQKEPKGLGHAVYCAKSFVGEEPFAVLLGDDLVHAPEKPCLKQLLLLHERLGGTVLGVQEVAREDLGKYGIIDGERVGERLYRVKGLVEKPALEEAPSRIAVLGRYIITPAIFEILARIRPGRGGEIQLTDALRELAQKEPVHACIFEGRRYDVGDRQGFLEATVEYALRREQLRDEFLRYLATVLKNAGPGGSGG